MDRNGYSASLRCAPSLKLFVFGFLTAYPALQPQPALSQINMAGGAMEMRDQIPPDDLPAPQKIAGVGNIRMKITAKPEAQMWFNQGLNLIHDFWDYESMRAFEQSVRTDPQCAICYWGLYQAESFYHSTTQGYDRQALDKAVSLKSHASRRERLYIEASAAHEDAVKTAKPFPNFSHEVELLRKLVKDDPKDTLARIYLAQVVDRKEGLALLQSVLKEEPDNSAANHYYIHFLEGTDHPEQALHSAEILARLAPASGHMVHMPGHIFYRIGDYAGAEQAFDASMQVDERYMREQHVKVDDDWNYVHNLMYAVANLLEEGKLREATALSAKLTGARGELESTLYINSARDSISRLNNRLPVALRTGDWTQVVELLKASPPSARLPNLTFLSRQLTGFANGMIAVESRDVAKAEESSTTFDAELWRMYRQSIDSSQPGPPGAVPGPPGTMPGMPAPAAGKPKLQVMPDGMLGPILSNLSVMSLELRASLAAMRGDTAESKNLFQKAAREEKALGYHEPPNYIRPVAETEGVALMAVGDYADAKAAYQRALVERPRSGLVLYGLAMSNEKSGDSRSAAKEYNDFLTAWKGDDPSFAQVKHAKAYVAEHPAS
ncbi:MAG TPA: tetratricopeptide repeat protein [Bryobacteraceae bacterium]|nr:tetratricopeptide repeat protein [Bryobacteraceae bacterium]